jgi:hypothetical protein
MFHIVNNSEGYVVKVREVMVKTTQKEMFCFNYELILVGKHEIL